MFHIAPDGQQFFNRIEEYLTPPEVELVRAAFDFARQEHGEQRRKSGELFFTHPLTVAFYLAEHQIDAAALIAALLHDVAEDTRVSVAQIETRFGQDVARIVDGVTKFEQTAEDVAQHGELTPEQKANATLHKLFRFMTRDMRVVIIKLFDRLHNMQTIGALPRQKQEKIAQETLDVYGPLANRLGMWSMKQTLQSLALRVVDYNAFRHINEELEQLYQEQKVLLDTLIRDIRQALQTANIPYLNVVPSPRNVYSIYENLWVGGRTQYHIDRTPRLLVVLPDRLTCYTALGAVHGLWSPMVGKFDDYIARPRENLYRALHTSVMHSNGFPVKLRFRTEAMNTMSEIGILARWARRGTAVSPDFVREVTEQVTALLQGISRIQDEPQDSADSVRIVVGDVLSRQITAYTPRGEAKELPRGATPIDFAYRVHTAVGLSCRGARVNGSLAPLNTTLQDGDHVEILRHRFPNPRRVWLEEDLGYIHTMYARNNVRRWFRRLSEEEAIQVGQQLLEDELAMVGLADYPLAEATQLMGFKQPQDLFRAVGRADVLPTTISTRLLTSVWNSGPLRRIGQVVDVEPGQRFVVMNAGSRPLKLCQACNPRPPENIYGYIRKDDGVTIHSESCPYLPQTEVGANRLLSLRWGQDENSQVRLAGVELDVFDRPNLLFEITDLLRQEMINIQWIKTPLAQEKRHLSIGLDIANPRQLVRVLHRLHALVNIHTVRCHLDGHGQDTPQKPV